MKTITNQGTKIMDHFFSKDKAIELAKANSEKWEGDGLTYKANEAAGSAFWVVNVYDETGEFMGRL